MSGGFFCAFTRIGDPIPGTISLARSLEDAEVGIFGINPAMKSCGVSVFRVNPPTITKSENQ